MNIAAESIAQFAKMLRNLDRWIEKSTAYAETKKFDVNNLVTARLAPDQYPLVRQVQACCDQAKFAAAYLSGKEAPKHPDTEQTMPELRQRIAACLGFLESVKAEELAGFEDRKVAPAWMHGKWLKGDHYLSQLAIPNFYFHVTTAYAIFRHNGVDVGKMDFVGGLPMKD